MNKNFTGLALGMVFMFLGHILYAQTTVTGTITETDTGEPLIGVNILVKGTVLGTITDINGNFSLTVQSAPPLTLVVSSVGFERQEIEVTQNNANLTLQLAESALLGQEVVVSASRVEESILQSPVSIEKMDILAVQNTSADTYYKAIANLKGVDIAASSINFQIINARGFGSTGNTRFVQLIDGMDTQAPALNFPIGNLNGPSVLDVESVELLPGASSALWGPNAFNGILLINSKNPFDYQGLSAFVKTGVNHVGANADQDPALMNTFSLRFAKAFNDKFAFKINGTFSYADDWQGTDDFDRNAENNPFASIGGVNPGADRLHFQGDEAAINLAIFPFSSSFNSLAQNRVFEAGLTARNYSDLGDLPNHVVSVTPYREADLIDYSAENTKLNLGLYYRLNDRMELSYLYNGGFGTSIYTGAQRYSLVNFGIQQHRLQLRGDNFFIRSYGTFEDSGDSYITEFLGLKVNESLFGGEVSQYLANYGVNYLEYLYDQGFAPGDLAALQASNPNSALQTQQAAHTYARQTTDDFFDLGNITPDQLAELREANLNGVVPIGPKFNDATKMYQTDVQYDFKNEIESFELQVGGSYRIFDLRSNGTIFPDADGGIQINEFGGYVQAGKRITDEFKISGSVRFDKNENFDGQVNPRISGVYTLGGVHNIRASFQTGFRNPTTQGQYIDLNTITTRLLGGLPQFYETYDLARTSSTGAPLAYTGGSVLAFRNSIFSGNDFATAAGELDAFTAADVKPVIPEQVRSIEFGYKSLIADKLLVDAVYYHNTYTDFITQVQIVIADENPDGTASLSSILNGEALTQVSEAVPEDPDDLTPDGFNGNTAQIYTNLENEVQSQGVALGLTYSLPKGYSIGGNYSWNVLIGGFTENNLNDFNTPEHKYNLNFGNREVIDNIGFNVTYRWQDSFRWESSFARGPVPEYSTLDMQVSYNLESIKSVLKLGGSNMFGDPYLQSLGGPNIGSIYYFSITFNDPSFLSN